MKHVGLIFILSTALSGCGDTSDTKTPPAPSASVAAVQKNGRLTCIDITLKNGGTYEEAITEVKSAGADFISMSLYWDEIETSPGIYNNTFPDIAQVYYPAKNMKVALNISTIDTTADRRPTDLKALAWNNAAVVQRFNNLTDNLVSRMPSVTFVSFAIGNEIDVWLGSDSAKWTAYTDFFNQTSAYAKTKFSSNVYIGTKTTYPATVSYQPAKIQTINTSATAVLVTYYPMNTDFTVKDPSVVASDLAAIVALYPGKPILFLEAGYQSGTVCASSEEKQRQFVANFFAAWDTHKDSIRAASFVWMHDKPQSEIDTLAAYYGISDAVFKDYLATLGLKNNNGSAKAAWTELLAQMNSRGM